MWLERFCPRSRNLWTLFDRPSEPTGYLQTSPLFCQSSHPPLAHLNIVHCPLSCCWFNINCQASRSEALNSCKFWWQYPWIHNDSQSYYAHAIKKDSFASLAWTWLWVVKVTSAMPTFFEQANQLWTFPIQYSVGNSCRLGGINKI